MTLVEENVYLGNSADAMAWDGEYLLCVLEGGVVNAAKTTHHVPILVGGVARRSALDKAADVIDAARANGRVLVHCGAGIERSPLTVAWWLVKRGRARDLDEAYAKLQVIRPEVADRRAWLESLP